VRPAHRLALLLILPACSDDDAAIDAAAIDAPLIDAPAIDAGVPDAASIDAWPPIPTPEDISFVAVSALPSGEQILFNDWNEPNAVRAVTPDGATTVDLFHAYRVWSLAAAPSGSSIAFACGDPEQEAHYGTAWGDAIQHTWIYDVATQTARPVGLGNVNDECHVFSADEASLYLCRRSDFTATGESSTYRLGRLDVASGAFTYLTPLVDLTHDLHPAPLADESAVLFTRIVITPPSTQHRSIQRLPLPTGDAAVIVDDASGVSLSPDGTRVAYSDWSDGFRLYVADLDGGGAVRVSDDAASRAVFSPDGTRLAYLAADDTTGCDHIDVVAADGSQASAPTRLRDCNTTGESITQLAWIDP
jgi:hypothetical protein